jgi:hypothetical protein
MILGRKNRQAFNHSGGPFAINKSLAPLEAHPKTVPGRDRLPVKFQVFDFSSSKRDKGSSPPIFSPNKVTASQYARQNG